MSFVTSPFKDFGLIPAVHFHPSMAEPLQNDAETADMLPSPTNDEPARTDNTRFFDSDDEISDDEIVEPASSSSLARGHTEFFNLNDEIMEPASSSSKLLTQQETVFFNAADSVSGNGDERADGNIATQPVATVTQCSGASTSATTIPSQNLAPNLEDKIKGSSHTSWTYPGMEIENPWAEGKIISRRGGEGDSNMFDSHEISETRRREL